MHGTIHLESALDIGTKATFSLQFNKPRSTEARSTLVELGALPERLKCDTSVSGCASDSNRASATPRQEQEPNTAIPPDNENFAKTCSISPSPHPSGNVCLDVSASDRKAIQVMVVEDNAINQQIALKTLRKFGFSCFAVWNGQEALDYLKEESAELHPMPNIILMDCQMPILDGLACTKAIRNHDPYINMADLQRVPIVAMTASAIQGDEEKCKEAGMDDYLAKPVKGQMLERMLTKWLFEKRGDHPSSSRSGHRQSNQERKMHNTDQIIADDIEMSPNASNSDLLSPSYNSDSRISDPNHSLSADGRTTSSSVYAALRCSSDTGQNRAAAEEKATSLRNDKLLAAAHGSDVRPDIASSLFTSSTAGTLSREKASSSRAALTYANIELLDRENKTSGTQALDDPSASTLSPRSLMATGDDSVPETDVDQEGLSSQKRLNDRELQPPFSPRGHDRKQGSNATSVKSSRNEGLDRNDSEMTVTRGNCGSGNLS